MRAVLPYLLCILSVLLIGPVAGATHKRRRFVNTGQDIVKKAKSVAAASAASVAADGHSHSAEKEDRLVAAAAPGIYDEDAEFWQ